MNQNEVVQFMESLNVTNVEVLKEFGYDDPADILSMDIELSKIQLERTQGYTTFECDSIDFDAKHNKLIFYQGDKPYLEQNVRDIQTIKVRIVEN